MKILIVSYNFPPFNTVGAVRVGKTAKYLAQLGHEIKVLTADNQPLLANLPVEIDPKNIIRTPWFDVNKPVQLMLGGKKSVAAKGYERGGEMPRFLRKLGYYYKDFINLPDGQIGWYPFAIKAGKKLLKTWRPDVILGSSPPVTSLLISKKLSKIFGIPWVADLRDLLADNHYACLYASSLRRAIDKKIEKYVLSTAAALIIVSEPLADVLRKKYAKPISVISNGYDLEDYPEISQHNDEGLRIVYTGIIYQQKQDPTALFKALLLLKDDAHKIRIDFYGRNNKLIKQMAISLGVSDLVNCYDIVPYRESLRLQASADILLLLLHNSVEEKGIVTSKFFEYLGARRPVLLLGCLDGVAANIIRERNVGFVENDPVKIAAFLKKCLVEKSAGGIPDLSLDMIRGFSRKETAKELEEFLNKLLRSFDV